MMYIERFDELEENEDQIHERASKLYEQEMSSSNDDEPFIVALEDENTLIGAIWMDVYDHPEYGDMIEFDIVIEPSSQKQGVGKKLANEFFKELEDYDGKIMAKPISAGGEALIKSLGFEDTGDEFWIKASLNSTVLVAALKRIVAKKAYIGYEAVDWLEGWVSDVKDPPNKNIIEAIDDAKEPVKPKIATTLYRGFNQGKYKTIKAMMKTEFGKILKVGDTIELDSKDYVSWSKSSKVAASFASRELQGGRITKTFEGFVVQAKVSPDDMFLEPGKIYGLDSHLNADIKAEKEVIVKPGKIAAVVAHIFGK